MLLATLLQLPGCGIAGRIAPVWKSRKGGKIGRGGLMRPRAPPLRWEGGPLAWMSRRAGHEAALLCPELPDGGGAKRGRN